MNVYRPDEREYRAAQEGTVFVRLNRGLIRGKGNDRLDLLHRLSTGDVGGLKPGQEGTTILTSDKGRVLEVLRVLAFDSYSLMLMQGTGVEEIQAWLDKYTIMDDFSTDDATSDYVLFGLYGGHAKPILERLLSESVPDSGQLVRVEGFGGIVIAIRDIRLNGAGSFTLIVSREAADGIEAALREAGCVEIGEKTRQALRIAVGQPEMGAEFTGEFNPLEAGLVSYISFTKGCYIGQEVIARLDTYDKVKRRLMGVVLEGSLDAPGILDGAEVTLREPVEDVAIGTMTSLTWSYEKNAPIGLCYIRSAYATPDLPVVLTSEDGRIVAKGILAKLPF